MVLIIAETASIVQIIFVVFAAVPTFEGKLLPGCSSSPPPCVHRDIDPKTVCEGANGIISIEFQLPLSLGQTFPPQGISVMHLDQIIIQGTELKGFLSEDEDSDEWVISLSYNGDLLTFRVNKSNVRQKDEFYSQFALRLDQDVWESTPVVWFDVQEDCDSDSQSTQDVARDTTTLVSIVTDQAEKSTLASGCCVDVEKTICN